MNADCSDNENSVCDPSAQTYKLPNGMSVYHLNQHETDFLYKEIFVERIYLKHGITLGSSACIVDVGANIGLFSLFIKSECVDACIHAFEPIPEINRILKLNMSRYGQSVQVYQTGMTDEEKDAEFTYYPDYTILSGLHTDASEDGNVLASGIRQQLAESRIKLVNAPDEYVNRLVQKKLGRKVAVKCRLKTVSGIVHEANIHQIDLLKIDAEKSELAILKGINEADWPKIKQIVLEVHSLKEVEVVAPLLHRKGFEIKVEKEGLFTNSDIFNCYAIRA